MPRVQKVVRVLAPLWFPLLRFAVLVVVVGLIGLIGVLTASSERIAAGAGRSWNLTGQYSPRWTNLTAFDGSGAAQARVLFDSHCHTTRSDAGAMTPSEAVQWHVAYGYDAFAVTDHNTVAGAIEAREYAQRAYNGSVVVVPGFEWTTSRFHFTILGIDDEPTDLHPNPTDDQVRQVVNNVHARGGVVGANHREWSLAKGCELLTLAQLESFGVDFIEVVSGHDVDMQALLAVQASKTTAKLGMLAGTAVRSAHSLPAVWMTLNPLETTTVSSIIAELRAHRASFVYETLGVPALVTNTTTATNSLHTFLFIWLNFGWFFNRYYE
jgi:hypothetical protein